MTPNQRNAESLQKLLAEFPSKNPLTFGWATLMTRAMMALLAIEIERQKATAKSLQSFDRAETLPRRLMTQLAIEKELI